jgi:hypothetical protein
MLPLIALICAYSTFFRPTRGGATTAPKDQGQCPVLSCTLQTGWLQLPILSLLYSLCFWLRTQGHSSSR